MILIKQNDRPRMPWKNGQGFTRQVAIFPEGAKVEDNSFLWRVSVAEIAAPKSDFSLFSGFHRLLSVWQGSGLRLNKNDLLPYAIASFSGSEAVECELIKDPVLDLGIIYKQPEVSARLDAFDLAAGEQISMVCTSKKTAFVFCAQGKLHISGHELNVGDALFINETIATKIIAFGDSRYFYGSMHLPKLD